MLDRRLGAAAAMMDGRASQFLLLGLAMAKQAHPWASPEPDRRHLAKHAPSALAAMAAMPEHCQGTQRLQRLEDMRNLRQSLLTEHAFHNKHVKHMEC